MNRGRGRWNDNFRDSRDYRRNDKFDRRGNRGGGRFNRFDRRSMSRSPLRSPKASPDRRNENTTEKKDRWADEPPLDKLNDSREKDDLKKTNSSVW